MCNAEGRGDLWGGVKDETSRVSGAIVWDDAECRGAMLSSQCGRICGGTLRFKLANVK